ncbi:MAG: hypothetical protein KF914_11200 [Rhizobiaceae bacterium]|nr:hypothetical protein [Rhizobiaceae bacterium]
MRRNALSWLVKVAIATATLAVIGAFAGTGRALAATPGTSGETPAHAAILLLAAWLMSSLRIRRRAGRLVLGFELSPIRRVRATSTVRRARQRSPWDNASGHQRSETDR